jgi:hypothetical protein
MKNIWKFLDGNKTIFGSVLLLITTIPAVGTALGGSLLVVQTIIGLLTGASLAHHVKKGYLSTKKQ